MVKNVSRAPVSTSTPVQGCAGPPRSSWPHRGLKRSFPNAFIHAPSFPERVLLAPHRGSPLGSSEGLVNMLSII